jgi:DNA repair protein RecO (recombination protein O)
MQLIQTEGVVLKSYNLAEADRIIVIFTRQSGLIRGVARGARKLKSRFGGALEPFTSIVVTFSEKEGRDLVTLTSTDIKQSLFSLTSRQDIVASFGYMANYLIKFSPPHEPNERIYRMVVAIIDALRDQNCDLAAIRRYFDVWLLKLSGFLPDVRRCSGCGILMDDSAFVLQDSDLRFICGNCPGSRGRPISPGVVTILRDALALSPAAFADQFKSFDPDSRDKVANLLNRYFERVLESDLGSTSAGY